MHAVLAGKVFHIFSRSSKYCIDIRLKIQERRINFGEIALDYLFANYQMHYYSGHRVEERKYLFRQSCDLVTFIAMQHRIVE